MELFNISNDVIIAYLIFGYAANLISTIIVSVVAAIRTIYFDKEEKNTYFEFVQIRSEHIKNNNSSNKLFVSALTMWCLPLYAAWLNMIVLYNLATYDGTYGLLRGIITADNWSIIKLVNYKIR